MGGGMEPAVSRKKNGRHSGCYLAGRCLADQSFAEVELIPLRSPQIYWARGWRCSKGIPWTSTKVSIIELVLAAWCAKQYRAKKGVAMWILRMGKICDSICVCSDASLPLAYNWVGREKKKIKCCEELHWWKATSLKFWLFCFSDASAGTGPFWNKMS